MMRKLTLGREGWPESVIKENCGSIDVPTELYVIGKDIPPKHRCLAIVGTRRPTAAGRETAAEFARRFGEAGFTVVSGLAIGIDAVAHAAALAAGGNTIAVLGCGVDRVYPRENAALRTRIESEGTLVSEYPPGTESRSHHFPARNRIIAALSLGVVVVEGNDRSGALITARFADDMNRSVWAVPGSTRNSVARGPNELIRRSQAKLVTTADHVFEEVAPSQVWSDPNISGPPPVTEPEQEVLFQLDDDLTSLGRIVSQSSRPTGEVALTLARLEARGMIVKRRGGYELTTAGARTRASLG